MVEYLFACGHRRFFNTPVPRRGQIVYCINCESSTKVERAVVQFTGTCADCNWSMTANKTYGNPESRAKALGKLHHTKLNHTVTVSYLDATIATFVANPDPTLDLREYDL